MAQIKSVRVLANHPPESYYKLWANFWHIDLQKHPYTKMDYDPAQDRLVPFAVFTFDLAKLEDGERVTMAYITYKSLFSKSSFDVVVYL